MPRNRIILTIDDISTSSEDSDKESNKKDAEKFCKIIHSIRNYQKLTEKQLLFIKSATHKQKNEIIETYDECLVYCSNLLQTDIYNETK